MRKVSFILIMLLLILTGCRTRKALTEGYTDGEGAGMIKKETDFHDPTTWLLGYFPRERMTRPPHSEWFNPQYDGYEFDGDVVNKLTMNISDDLKIKIVLGSWCPDSRREVPRFMKIIDFLKYPVANVTFIGVDDSKISPVGEYNTLDIQRVPTFIFYKNNVEAGRIIEVPLTSLEQDMLNILLKE